VTTEAAALKDAIAQYRGGLVDFNRVVLIQERLVERQQTLADAQGQIALGLIQVYRALGGGWQIRCDAAAVPPSAPHATLGPPVFDESLPEPRRAAPDRAAQE